MICTVCYIDKPLDTDYYRNPTVKSGYARRCKVCYRQGTVNRSKSLRHQPTLYYRSSENYIGVTNSIILRAEQYRFRGKTDDITPITTFKDNDDALIVEALLQRDYSFSGGWWKVEYYASQAKQAHKRLAKRISVRIFNV